MKKAQKIEINISERLKSTFIKSKIFFLLFFLIPLLSVSQYNPSFSYTYTSFSNQSTVSHVFIDETNASYSFLSSGTNTYDSSVVVKRDNNGTIQWESQSIPMIVGGEMSGGYIYFVSANSLSMDNKKVYTLDINTGTIQVLFEWTTIFGNELNVENIKVIDEGILLFGAAGNISNLTSGSWVGLFDFSGEVIWSRFNLLPWSDNANAFVRHIEKYNDKILVLSTIENPGHNYNRKTGDLRVLNIENGNDIVQINSNKELYSPRSFFLKDDNAMIASLYIWNDSLYNSIEAFNLTLQNHIFTDSINLGVLNGPENIDPIHTLIENNGTYFGLSAGINFSLFPKKFIWTFSNSGVIEDSLELDHVGAFNFAPYNSNLRSLNMHATEQGVRILGHKSISDVSQRAFIDLGSELNVLGEFEASSVYGGKWNSFAISTSGCAVYTGFDFPAQSFKNGLISQYCTPTASINETDKKLSFSVYPNPTRGLINIVFHDADQNYSAKVLSISGQVVESDTSLGNENLQLNLENQPAGLYFLEIVSDRDIKTIVKVVKE